MENSILSADNYLSLILQIPNLTPITLLSTLFLLMARLLPIMVLAPFFGTKMVPMAIRVMFSLSLAFILLPPSLLSLKRELTFDLVFAGLALKELLIGFILGFLAAAPFYIAQSSGSLIDHIRGSSSLQMTEPTTNIQTGPVGLFYNYVLIATFYFIGGPLYFIDALARSLQLIPIDQLISPSFFSLNISFWKVMTHLIDQIVTISIQLGAPSIIGILMGEMFLGITNRLAPQVQIVFLGISLKSWIGLGLLAVAWYFVMTQLSKESLSWLQVIEKTIREAAPATL
jgi:type III secretion protein SpaR/YscT/HrcT